MNVPNLLSLFRLALVPVFMGVFFSNSPHAHSYAAGVYALAFITDIADGFIARHFNLVTKLGRILDPFADKVMTFTVIASITIVGIIPLWAILIFLAKELAMFIGALLLYRRVDDVIASNWLGKISTFSFFIVCAALVLFPAIPSDMATWLIAGTLVLAWCAFFRYLLLYRKILRDKKDS